MFNTDIYTNSAIHDFIIAIACGDKAVMMIRGGYLYVEDGEVGGIGAYQEFDEEARRFLDEHHIEEARIDLVYGWDEADALLERYGFGEEDWV